MRVFRRGIDKEPGIAVVLKTPLGAENNNSCRTF